MVLKRGFKLCDERTWRQTPPMLADDDVEKLSASHHGLEFREAKN